MIMTCIPCSSSNEKTVDLEKLTYISRELIGHELTVLPDTNDIWKVEDGGVLVDDISSGFSDIGVNASNLDRFSGGRAVMLGGC